MCFFFFKQKTAYEMRISDWSSDVCSSDLHEPFGQLLGQLGDGELLQVAQNREDGPQDLSHPRRRQSRRVQLHRSVLQRETAPLDDRLQQSEIGRAARRERVVKYVEIQVVGVSLKKKNKEMQNVSRN